MTLCHGIRPQIYEPLEPGKIRNLLLKYMFNPLSILNFSSGNVYITNILIIWVKLDKNTKILSQTRKKAYVNFSQFMERQITIYIDNFWISNETP